MVRVFLDFVIWAAADLQALAQRFLLLVRFRFGFEPLLVRCRFGFEPVSVRDDSVLSRDGSILVRYRRPVRRKDFGED